MGGHIDDGSVSADDLDTDSVASLEILDNSITADDIGSGAVGSDELQDQLVLGQQGVDAVILVYNASGTTYSAVDSSAVTAGSKALLSTYGDGRLQLENDADTRTIYLKGEEGSGTFTGSVTAGCFFRSRV